MAMYGDEPTMMGQARPSATLVIRQGPQAGMSFPLTGNQMIIGREEGLEIALQDPESSRRHSRVTWQGNQFVIEDLGSTNGTFVNGVQADSLKIAADWFIKVEYDTAIDSLYFITATDTLRVDVTERDK